MCDHIFYLVVKSVLHNFKVTKIFLIYSQGFNSHTTRSADEGLDTRASSVRDGQNTARTYLKLVRTRIEDFITSELWQVVGPTSQYVKYPRGDPGA